MAARTPFVSPMICTDRRRCRYSRWPTDTIYPHTEYLVSFSRSCSRPTRHWQANRKITRILQSKGKRIMNISIAPGDLLEVFSICDCTKSGMWSAPKQKLQVDHSSWTVILSAPSGRVIRATIEYMHLATADYSVAYYIRHTNESFPPHVCFILAPDHLETQLLHMNNSAPSSLASAASHTIINHYLDLANDGISDISLLHSPVSLPSSCLLYPSAAPQTK